MNRAEIEQLAKAGAAMRTDWRYDSLVTFLTTNAATRPLWDAARALVWIALEPGLHAGEYANKTPRLFTEHGPWWAQQVVVTTKADEPTPTPIGWCSLHRCEDSTRNPCRLCLVDHANALRDAERIQAIRAAARAETRQEDATDADE